jgi:hypothetical protein
VYVSSEVVLGFDMVESERELLHERDDDARFGERVPYESVRQAAYEDSFAQPLDWEHDDSD